MNLNNINSDSLIPFDWEIKKIKYIAEVNTGSTPSTSKEEFYKDGDTLWVKPGNLNNFLPIINTDQKLSDAGLKISKELKENSSLVCGIGDIGKFGFSEEKVTTNQQIHGITFNKKFMIAKYGIYVISSLQEILKKESEKVVVSILTKRKLELIKVIVPPLVEQKLISQYLDKKTKQIDSLIEKIEKKIELLKEQKTALINQCVTKGLNPNVEKKDSGVEWIGKIPSHWQLLRLNNLGRFSKGKGITKDKIKVNGNKCIRCGEIYTTYELRFNRTRSFIDDDTSDESVLATKGVLLFTGDGESLEEIGKCIVYEGEEDLYIGGGINVFAPKQEKVIPIYLSYVMNSESVIYQKSRQGKGEIVVHIYSKQLKEIRLGLPSIKEQQQIVEYLDQKTSLIDKIISYENKRLLFLKEYKKSLISEVVTGKKRVV